MTTEHDRRLFASTPYDFDYLGAAKSGEIGCFNCAHRFDTAKSGEVICERDATQLTDPDYLDAEEIAECWECE